MALSVIIKTTDDAEIKASRDLVTKYFGVVREFPGFGEEDDKEDNEEVPLSHSKTVIERMIAFAEKFNTEEFKPPRVRCTPGVRACAAACSQCSALGALQARGAQARASECRGPSAPHAAPPGRCGPRPCKTCIGCDARFSVLPGRAAARRPSRAASLGSLSGQNSDLSSQRCGSASALAPAAARRTPTGKNGGVLEARRAG